MKLLFYKLFCKLFGHDEEQIKDYKLNDEEVITDNFKVKDFNFPIVIHCYRCKRCMKIRKSNPDIPGSLYGLYKVHYT